MPRLPDPLALAARLRLSPVWRAKSLASAAWAAPVCSLPTPHYRDGWHHASGQPFALATVAASDVVSDQSKERNQYAGLAAHSGLGQLSNGLDPAPQTAPGHGASRAGPAQRARRSG